MYDQEKVNAFKEQAQKQRQKIKDMKETGAFPEGEPEMEFDDAALQGPPQ